MTEVEILAKIRDRYQHCLEYSDQGVVTNNHHLKKYETSGTLSCRFRRNLSFEFEWSGAKTAPKFKLESNFKETMIYSTSGFKEQYRSIEAGIIALSGVTLGASLIVPVLLMSSSIGIENRVTNLKNVTCATSAEGAILVRGDFSNIETYVFCFSETFEIQTCEVHTDISEAQVEALYSSLRELPPQLIVKIPDVEASKSLTRIIYSDVRL